jgi:hypothetical protein
MPRIKPRCQVVKWSVLLLAGLLAAPVFDARDFAPSHGAAATVFAFTADAANLEGIPDAYEDDTDTQNLFSCMPGSETYGVPLAPTGEVLNPARLHLRYASHLPKIYHPPLV